MYKVLVVDDERIIREGMAQTVAWQRYGAMLHGVSANGKEAYALIESDPPDIVIADVKMPEWDGLQLLERVKEGHPHVEFIMLSGYDEFEYATRAMAQGVTHYLLKPCGEERLGEALQEVIAKLRRRKERAAYLAQVRERYEAVAGEALRALEETDQARAAELASKLRSALNAGGQWEDREQSEARRAAAGRHSRPVQEAIRAVRLHLHKRELSLRWIAQEVLFMNEDYLGRLFREETGERFSEHVNRVRVDKAKAILESDPEAKVYEVADQVGFGDNPQYFSQVFRRLVGRSPSDFKAAAKGSMT